MIALFSLARIALIARMRTQIGKSDAFKSILKSTYSINLLFVILLAVKRYY
jgi:hypothetical protein